MLNPSLSFAEPFLQEEVRRNIFCCGQVVSFVCVFIGFGFGSVILWSSLLGNSQWSRQELTPQVFATNLVVQYKHFEGPRQSLPTVRARRSIQQVKALATHEPGTLSEFVTTNSGVQMPRLIYGAKWDKDSTQDLVRSAVRTGFRGLDIASGIGERLGAPDDYSYHENFTAGLGALLAAGVARDSLFIQTGVNPHSAAELSPNSPIAKQVEISIANSLSNLGIDYVDSLVLRSPYPEHEQTMEAWHAMELAVRAGLVRQLGISNVASLEQLRRIHAEVTVKPAIVQQRLSLESGFERQMRAWCAEVGIYYQSFRTLSANMDAISSKTMQSLADKYGVKPPVLFFRFVMGLGVVPLTGKCTYRPVVCEGMMKEDLSAWRVPLAAKDAELIDGLLVS